MKRSGQVGLVLMGAAAFAATFVGGMAYFAWQKPSHAAQAQTATSGQNCTPGADGTQNCQQRRGFAYFFYPRWVTGWSSGPSSSSEPRPKSQSAALSNSSRSYAPPASGNTSRGGFGSTAQSGSFRTSSAGG